MALLLLQTVKEHASPLAHMPESAGGSDACSLTCGLLLLLLLHSSTDGEKRCQRRRRQDSGGGTKGWV